MSNREWKNIFKKPFEPFLAPAFWRALVNLWSLLALVFFTYEFITGNPDEQLATQVAIIYIGVLGLYVGTKEFRRWHREHLSTYYGEFYVLLWTALMVIFMILSATNSDLKIGHDLTAVYLAVISIFAVTTESKRLRRHRK